MSKNEKNTLEKIIELLVLLLFAIVFAAIGIKIYTLFGEVKKETDKSAGASGFTVEYQDKTITSSTNNVVFTSSETFTVTQHGGESELSVAIYAKPADYTATYSVTKGDEVTQTVMNWKDLSDTDFTHCFSSAESDALVTKISNGKYEINVKGTMVSVLDEYLYDYQVLTSMSAIPDTDMFYMQIKSGEETLNIGFRVYAQIENISLDKLSFC